VAEVVMFGGVLAFDEVMAGRLGLRRPGGGLSTAVVLLVVALAVARRRSPGRLAVLAGAVLALSAAHSTVAVLDRSGVISLPVGFSLTEMVAVAVVVGAAARTAPGRVAVAVAVAGGAAITAAPFARTGTGVEVRLFAVPGALLWGAALAFGLVLRDADARRVLAFAEIRRAERMRIARELHDVVTHHVTGIAVRAQAAQLVAARPGAGADHERAYEEIQRAAAASLTAMRRLVGMLRAEDPPPAETGIRAALAGAVAADPRVRVDIADDADAVDPGPDVSATLHWVALEALTNVRAHALEAVDIRVAVRLDGARSARCLVLEVANDGVTTADPAAGREPAARYGLTGMRERVLALGGTLLAGPEPGDRWRVTARVPLARRRTPAGRDGPGGPY
jgi:signal transduction histidine kinase